MHSLRSAISIILATILLALHAPSALAKQQNIRVYLYKRTEIASAPYLVQLRRKDGKFFCAGALLAANYVLTAAECFDNEDFAKSLVVGGVENLDGIGVQRHIEKVIKHPAYNAQTKQSNAAVLKLKGKMECSKSFQFEYIKLADRKIDANVHPQTVGWRHFVDMDHTKRKLYMLRYALAPQDVCQSKFNSTDESNIFCIVGDDYDGHYCVEDLGSPTIYRRKLVGIATSAQNCKTPGYYVSYTNVYNIKSFIKKAMKS